MQQTRASLQQVRILHVSLVLFLISGMISLYSFDFLRNPYFVRRRVSCALAWY